jgi:hypothetical protein
MKGRIYGSMTAVPESLQSSGTGTWHTLIGLDISLIKKRRKARQKRITAVLNGVAGRFQSR